MAKTMSLRDLIDSLQDLADEYGDDTEVRIAQQPQWPFEYSIGDIQAVSSGDDDDDDDDAGDEAGAEEAEGKEATDDETVIYIGEGRQLGYLPGAAANALGWGRR